MARQIIMQSKPNIRTHQSHIKGTALYSSFDNLSAMRVPEFDKKLFKLFTYWYYSLF